MLEKGYGVGFEMGEKVEEEMVCEKERLKR